MGADAITHGDDFGTQIGTFTLHRRYSGSFSNPGWNGFADSIHAKGCIAICTAAAKVDTLMDDFVEGGLMVGAVHGP